jgi:hypothetical protein
VEEQRFDALVRTFAEASSRRDLLRALVAGALGTIATLRMVPRAGATRRSCVEDPNRCHPDLCQVCDGGSGRCVSACDSGSCEVCRDGACVSRCAASACRVCNGRGRCAPACSREFCQICRDGTCVGHCGEGESCCNGRCRDVLADPENCGDCGNRCADLGIAGMVCIDAGCACPNGTFYCRATNACEPTPDCAPNQVFKDELCACVDCPAGTTPVDDDRGGVCVYPDGSFLIVCEATVCGPCEDCGSGGCVPRCFEGCEECDRSERTAGRCASLCGVCHRCQASEGERGTCLPCDYYGCACGAEEGQDCACPEPA